jgi:hypothetical protein
MEDPKDLMLRLIEAKARRHVLHLTYRLVRAPSAQLEVVFAELEFNRWLAETCQMCLDRK